MTNRNHEYIFPVDYVLTSRSAKETILLLKKDIEQLNLDEHYEDSSLYASKNIISIYLHSIEKKNYKIIIEDYKRKFIYNEAIVEPGVTKGERRGLGLIYDYISSYSFEKNEPNIFVEGLRLHSILYSQTEVPEFGGRMRETGAVLNDSLCEVPDATTAKSLFQSYITKKLEYDIDNIFPYIDESIKIAIDLIKIQPFGDGNKRTFRALLNLLFARIGIPPVYIKQRERDIYKRELLRAIEEDNYKPITAFYYHKICEAIIDLDLMRSQDDKIEVNDGKKFIIEPKK